MAKQDEMVAGQKNIEAGNILGKSWDCLCSTYMPYMQDSFIQCDMQKKSSKGSISFLSLPMVGICKGSFGLRPLSSGMQQYVANQQGDIISKSTLAVSLIWGLLLLERTSFKLQ